MLSIRSAKVRIVLICIVSTFLSCSHGTTSSGEEEVNPWEVIIESGNFAINTSSIVIWEDARSIAATNYYVNENSLPNADFEFFDINIFVPIREDINIYLNNIEAEARFEDVSSTGDIYYSGEFVQRGVELFDDGQEYSQFRLTSRYTGQRALNSENFANYHITFDVQFIEKETDDVLHEIKGFYNEVYKKE